MHISCPSSPVSLLLLVASNLVIQKYMSWQFHLMYTYILPLVASVTLAARRSRVSIRTRFSSVAGFAWLTTITLRSQQTMGKQVIS